MIGTVTQMERLSQILGMLYNYRVEERERTCGFLFLTEILYEYENERPGHDVGLL